jgi:hypothetical protein
LMRAESERLRLRHSSDGDQATAPGSAHPSGKTWNEGTGSSEECSQKHSMCAAKRGEGANS